MIKGDGFESAWCRTGNKSSLKVKFVEYLNHEDHLSKWNPASLSWLNMILSSLNTIL